MIDLSRSRCGIPLIQTMSADPGRVWKKEATVAIDAPPDGDVCPQPDARWSRSDVRTGLCGAVGPRAIRLPSGEYRLYYSQILPRPGFPEGANDYANSTTRILSAWSADGAVWVPEAGVRLTPQEGGAGDFRVVSSEVVPLKDGSGLRMYYECCPGSQSDTNSIRSAVSYDGGLDWTPEPGARLELPGRNYSAPRILFLDDGRLRLFCLERDQCGYGLGIMSAVSGDGGLTFERESGYRISSGDSHDALVAFASEIIRLETGGYIMYYAGYSQPNRAYILRASSKDGLNWTKDAQPVISPGPAGPDAAKCSEMCLVPLPPSVNGRAGCQMLYEACDGTAANERGVWRIASAVSA